MVSNGTFIAHFRVSTDKQGKSGFGLEAQRAAVTNYINGGKWKIIAEFTEVESGKRSDRPQLDAALKAALLHRAALVVSKVDRLTRSVALLSKLLEANVDVRFADLPQIEGPTGRYMLQQMAFVAKLEAGHDFRPNQKGSGCGQGARQEGSDIARATASGSPSLQTFKPKPWRRCRRVRPLGADYRSNIKELQAGGADSLRAIAAALTKREFQQPGAGQMVGCPSSTEAGSSFRHLGSDTALQASAVTRGAAVLAYEARTDVLNKLDHCSGTFRT